MSWRCRCLACLRDWQVIASIKPKDLNCPFCGSDRTVAAISW